MVCIVIANSDLINTPGARSGKYFCPLLPKISLDSPSPIGSPSLVGSRSSISASSPEVPPLPRRLSLPCQLPLPHWLPFLHRFFLAGASPPSLVLPWWCSPSLTSAPSSIVAPLSATTFPHPHLDSPAPLPAPPPSSARPPLSAPAPPSVLPHRCLPSLTGAPSTVLPLPCGASPLSQVLPHPSSPRYRPPHSPAPLGSPGPSSAPHPPSAPSHPPVLPLPRWCSLIGAPPPSLVLPLPRWCSLASAPSPSLVLPCRCSPSLAGASPPSVALPHPSPVATFPSPRVPPIAGHRYRPSPPLW